MSTTSTDPIADMLTRIRNAINVRKNEASLPHSNVKAVASCSKSPILLTASALKAAWPRQNPDHPHLQPTTSSPGITEIKRLSTPGRRHYSVAPLKSLWSKRGRGVAIVSTSKGMDDRRSRQEKPMLAEN